MKSDEKKRESENEHENNLAILSSIDPITTTSTSTGDRECVSKWRVMRRREKRVLARRTQPPKLGY